MLREKKKLSLEKTPPLYLRIYQILKEAIVSGDFAPGENMTETKLAEQLNVSRTPIRDAIRQLAKDGLVVLQENGTATVFAPTVLDVAEIYVTRAALEAQSAAIVSSQITPELIQELEEIINRSIEANERGDVKEVVNYNTQFHQTITHASQNQKLIEMIDAMQLQILQVRRTSLNEMQHRSTSLQEHRQIIEALKSGDSLFTQQIVSEHILKAGSRLIQHLGIPDKPTPSVQFLLRYS